MGLSWAAAQVYPVVPALLLMRISALGPPRQLAALPSPMCSSGAHQRWSLCAAFRVWSQGAVTAARLRGGKEAPAMEESWLMWRGSDRLTARSPDRRKWL